MKQHQLALYLPGLLHGSEHWREPAFCQDLELPSLELILSRAKRGSDKSQDPDSRLFELFGYPAQPPAVAAVSRLIDTGQDAPEFCLRADPVCVSPDRDRVIMMGNQHLNIRQSEAEQLVQEFNQLFGEDGLRLEAAVLNRWYLITDQAAAIRTEPLQRVIGQDIHRHLPSGEASMQWHSILNEVQMLFYSSSVNQSRRNRGEAEINSLWFWGEGQLPSAQKSPWQQVWANDVLSRGLARLSGIDAYSIPVSAEDWLEEAEPGGPQLLVMDALAEASFSGDLYQWREQLKGIEEYWLSPLCEALKKKQLESLSIWSDNVQFELSAAGLGHWWKRRRSFESFTR